ncbi:MAG: hypothetical protein OHK0045_19130 [Raineya sp.]
MKHISIILLSFLHIFALYAQEGELSLEEALASNMIQANFQGNPKSLHYIKPLKATISNVSNKKLKILIEAGSFFKNTSQQDILTTMPLMLILQAGESKKIELFGISTQADVPPPSEGSIYVFQKTPKKEYIAYAKFIAQEKLYNTAEAQYGLWIISEKQDIRKLMQRSLREDIALLIRDFLVQLLHISENLDDVPRELHHKILIDSNLVSTYTLTAANTAPTCEVKGAGSFSLKTTKEVRLVMFDSKGVLVREIYYNPKEKAGTYKLRYGYDCDYYKDEAYIVSLVFDGKIHVSTRLVSRK